MVCGLCNATGACRVKPRSACTGHPGSEPPTTPLHGTIVDHRKSVDCEWRRWSNVAAGHHGITTVVAAVKDIMCLPNVSAKTTDGIPAVVIIVLAIALFVL